MKRFFIFKREKVVKICKFLLPNERRKYALHIFILETVEKARIRAMFHNIGCKFAIASRLTRWVNLVALSNFRSML